MEKRLIPSPRTLDDVKILSRDLIGRGWGKLERFVFRHPRKSRVTSTPSAKSR